MRFTAFTAMMQADQMLDYAVAAEQAGWDTIGVTDSVFFPETVSADYPHVEGGERFWTAETPYVDPFVSMPAMAAVTKRVGFFVGVLKAPIRQPLLVAKTLGSMASLFPGRIALGVGTSWIPEEYTWLNEDWASRGKRLDVMMEIIRRCLRPGWAEFHGQHYDFGRLAMSPVPPVPVPIYVGGHAPPALRRAATLGDGWISVDAEFDQLAASIPKLRELRSASPRADDPYEIIAVCYDHPSVDAVRRYADLGITNLAITPFTPEDLTIEQKRDGLRRYAEEVIMRLAEAG